MKKQTAGRDHLGNLAPKFAELNDDVLFGEVWSREKELSTRDRSMITIAALFSAGLYPQLKSHLALGKEHGITKDSFLFQPKQNLVNSFMDVIVFYHNCILLSEEYYIKQKIKW